MNALPKTLWLPPLAVGGLLTGSLPSLLVAKKIIGLLLMPTGLAWLALMFLACWPGLRKGARLMACLALSFYTLAGNAWVGGWLLRQVEAPYAQFAAPAEPFDAICVLGGGSSATPQGTPQLGAGGDRLIVPLRLYRAGKAKQLVASGTSISTISLPKSLAEETARIWRDLGVPAADIIEVPGPRNTAEEVRAYRELAAQRGWKHLAICSSAWHLRRVQLLCKKEGLAAELVPADFLSGELPWSPMYAVPQTHGFQNVQKALWEYLGGLAGG